MLCRVPQAPESLHWASHPDPKSLNLKCWHCSHSLAWVTLKDLGARAEYRQGGRGFSNGNDMSPRFWFPWSVCNVPQFLFTLCSSFICSLFFFYFSGRGWAGLPVARAGCAGTWAVSYPCQGLCDSLAQRGSTSEYKTHHEFWPHRSPSGSGPKLTGNKGDRFQ